MLDASEPFQRVAVTVKNSGGRVDARGPVRRDREAPTVMIVHGAWADGTRWREVIALLHVEGLSVVAVQNR